MLSNNLEHTLKKALIIATDRMHEYATYEHLLLALIDDSDVCPLLEANNIDTKSLSKRLKNYLSNDLSDLVKENIKEAKPTAGFQRIIQRAALHNRGSAQDRMKKVITGTQVLAEFFFEHESYALLCLKELNLNRNDVLIYTKKKQGTKKNITSKKLKSQEISLLENNLKQSNKIKKNHSLDKVVGQNKNLEIEERNKDQSELEKYCVNLNMRADIDSIDCLIGRHKEIQRTIEILCRRKKNNAILIGEPGVGKTAIAEGMAIRIVKKDVPESLQKATIYSLNMGSLLAGTKFRGDFEGRIKGLLKELKDDKNAILFIDEIHTMIGAGSTTGGALDASNLLKPALANGEIRCIGSTTFKEYTNHFEKDAALVRRFQKIPVIEPDEVTALSILQGLKGYYEKHHNVVYTDSALKSAISLSERYINDRYLPDKAIDLIDEAGSRSKMNKNSGKKITITNKDIENLLSSILDIPQISCEADDITQLKELSKKLQSCIFGQDEAINSLCDNIKLSRAGLKKGKRPTGCYLFSGPSGVGKTELSKQLAKFNHMNLIKLDMSEFAESSSISKMLGSAPGYVGFEQGGILSSEVDKCPYSVVLFDEIEKAHPDIFNLLLQIMDEGSITDSNGKNINFTHTIIILTSNVLAQKQKASIGFNEQDKLKKPEINMDAINAQFSPELRSRLDKIILFNPINDIADKIVSKNLEELAAQLADKKVRLIVSDAVQKYLIQHCFNNSNGARELDRIIDSSIKQSIADEILFGKLKNGGTANIDFSNKKNEIIFQFGSENGSCKSQLEAS